MKENWRQKMTRDSVHFLALLGFYFEKIFPRRNPTSLPSLSSSSSILLAQSHHFGDLILTLPAIRACRVKYPDAKITLLLGSWQKPLANLVEGVDEIIYFDFPWTSRSRDKKPNFFAVLKLIRKLKKENFDISFSFSPDFYLNLILWRAQIKKRVGFENAGKRFLTDPRADREDCHQSENLISLIAGDEMIVKARPAPRVFSSSELASARARQKRWARVGVAGLLKRDNHLVAIQMISGAPARDWPKEYSEKLIDILTKLRYKVVVIEKLGLPLSDLPKFLASCRVFIGPNSGPGHLAALVGTPVISIFSAANNPQKWQPRGKNVIVLVRDVKCKNCGFHICPKSNHCLKLIKPEEVVQCLKRIYPKP